MSTETNKENPEGPLGAGIKLTTEYEYEAIFGRLAALELLAAQHQVEVLMTYRPEDREAINNAQQIALEDRFSRLSPIAQRVALESMCGIMDSALKTATEIERLKKTPGHS